MVGNGTFSLKMDVEIFLEILNFEGNLNCITGSIGKSSLLNGLILPINGASAVEGLLSRGLPRLVLKYLIECMGVTAYKKMHSCLYHSFIYNLFL